MLDNGLSLTIIIVSAIMIMVTLYFLAVMFKEIVKKERSFTGNGIKGALTLILSGASISMIAYCFYNIPRVLFGGVSWVMIEEMGPESLIKASVCMAVVIPVFYIYFLMNYFFTKPDDKPYFLIIVLSIASGFGNSLMVFIINEALNRTLNDESRRAGIESGLYLYFILGFMLFSFCAVVVRKKLIILTNKMIYEKRIDIINYILKAPYYKFERLKDGKTHAALNNDAENVSGFVSIFVSILTGSISMIVCFVYLGTLNLLGSMLSILIVVAASAFFIMASQSAAKLFEKNRDIQNVFFSNINDLINGFKELYINKNKREEFKTDIKKNCELYKDTRVEGDFQFVGVTIMGEFLYMFVIAVVVFTFPLIFRNIQSNTLRSFVLVYLYMGGIVTMLTSLIPELVRMVVNWKRIINFIGEISSTEDENKEIDEVSNEGMEKQERYESINQGMEKLELELRDVKFQYKNKEGEKFSVGPLSYKFKSGEIVFISGGNGSGKSTLAKLITGLYTPDEGSITVNGTEVRNENLGNYFSTVYSDFYLFSKLYGINCEDKKDYMENYLDILKLKDKVQVKKGNFSTTKLSTGQRKRLALFISYLEDRPGYFFDEWAADQDPEFRKLFYTVLLPELKARGKMVIAITHDDSYFDWADRLIKMETGRIVEERRVLYA